MIKTITLNEETKSVRVTVEEEELSKAIGRRGQNARLTARLVGWDVQVQKDESAHEAFEARVVDAAKQIAEATGIEMDVVLNLVRGGVNSLEMLASHEFKVIVFIGANQKNIPLEFASAMQTLSDARYIQVSGNGSSSLTTSEVYTSPVLEKIAPPRKPGLKKVM